MLEVPNAFHTWRHGIYGLDLIRFLFNLFFKFLSLKSTMGIFNKVLRYVTLRCVALHYTRLTTQAAHIATCLSQICTNYWTQKLKIFFGNWNDQNGMTNDQNV